MQLRQSPSLDTHFDWTRRTSDLVLTLPFVEGTPSPEKAVAMSAWVRSNADLVQYQKRYVRFYHATAASLPIESEGLKPASATRRRSYQSTSGYVYLANTPERAMNFGRLGNQGQCAVYEVLVWIRDLLPDTDQLNNQRSVGLPIGNSIGESIIYGGGVRVKGRIEPWAIRPLAMPSQRVMPAQQQQGHAFSTDEVMAEEEDFPCAEPMRP